jgi:hypothetical protein
MNIPGGDKSPLISGIGKASWLAILGWFVISCFIVLIVYVNCFVYHGHFSGMGEMPC